MHNIETKKFDLGSELSHADLLTNPILDIAARFWVPERYEAFKVCYRSMRLIDDLVDEKKTNGPISTLERRTLETQVQAWLMLLNESETSSDPNARELRSTITKFEIPLWPWERLAEAMIFDLSHDGFISFREFLRYSKGSAVAPAAIFMHLAGIGVEQGIYAPPAFDIRKAARPLALFSYLVHTVRDFQVDQLAGLNTFADDIVNKAGSSKTDILSVARGGAVTGSFRDLMKQYKNIAEYYQERARVMIDEIKNSLEPRSQLSLEIIYGLYSQIFVRIDPENGTFREAELNPTPQEVNTKLNSIVADFAIN